MREQNLRQRDHAVRRRPFLERPRRPEATFITCSHSAMTANAPVSFLRRLCCLACRTIPRALVTASKELAHAAKPVRMLRARLLASTLCVARLSFRRYLVATCHQLSAARTAAYRASA